MAYFALEYAVDSYAIAENLRIAGWAANAVGHQDTAHVWLVDGRSRWDVGVATGRRRALGATRYSILLMTIEWPEDAGSTIEGKERIDLNKVEDQLEKRARESGHLKD